MTASTLLGIPAQTTAPITAREPQAPLRLLHVEDNPSDALLTQETLRGVLPSAAFDTAVRLSEVTAERALAATCAILDLSLPDATGIEAVTALRGLSDTLPIIVLTGLDDLELALSALRFGADDYLIKNDADGYTLERAIRYAIERRRLWLELSEEGAAQVRLARLGETAGSQPATDRVVAGPQGAAREGGQGSSDVLLGTHEVSVRIDDDGDYALACQSCDWEAARNEDGVHTWTEQSLDLKLLSHVDFGGHLPTRPAPAPTAPPVRLALVSESAVSRRSFLRPLRRRGNQGTGEH